jgi:hypothetical protein|tara:strand:+ start:801 stop:1214 length:414 start_codon:yes stop_codon:yes gene_type:complete
VYDELSVSFENPATDAMGYQHIEGKLYCGRDWLESQFKEKDRSFRKGDTTVVRFDYREIESAEFISEWLQPKFLILQTRSPEKLDKFPGADVSRVELQVTRGSIKHAKRVADPIEFRQSESFLEESEDRLGRQLEKG